MRRRIPQLSLMVLILGGLGCQHSNSSVNTKQPPDPLLISKKPVEGKPTSYEPVAVNWRGPQAPAEPARDAVVAQPIPGRPVAVGTTSGDDASVTLGKPRWLPSGQ